MSTPTRPQLNAEKSLGGYTQRHARKLYIGELGNNSGVVDDTARTTSGQDFVFVRLNQDANQVVSALAATSFPHVADIIVILELVERKGAPYYQVLGIAPNIVYSTATATWSGVPGEHANQHERRDRGAGGFDPLDVYTRALVNLRARAQTTPDLTLHVEHGFYIFSSVKQYLGGNSPAFVPPAAASSQRWDLLYLGSDDALHITSGVVASGFSVPAYPACPIDSIPLAYVLLRTAQTSILEADITDARVLWTGTPSSGATLLGIFGWYDAVVDGLLDNTGAADCAAALQTLINTATANGTRSATIYFPSGVYKIAGALQSPGTFNGQILLPSVDYSVQQITLTFVGASRTEDAGLVIAGTPKSGTGYSVLKSTLAGASGTAAMFSGGQWAGGGSSVNNIVVSFRDLVIEVPPNPTFTALNLANVQGNEIKDVFIYTGETTSVTQPTNNNAYGIKLPRQDCSNYTRVQGLLVSGFYTAVQDGELAYVEGLRVGNCIRCVEVPFANYPSLYKSFFYAGCQYGFYATGSAGKCLEVLQFSAEHLTTPAWQVTVADLYDNSNTLTGKITWQNCTAGVGNDHTFTKTGGAGVQTVELGFDPVGTVTQVSTGTGLSGGPITGSGTVSLANTAVTPGSYTNTNLTVDAQGRLTAASNGSSGGGAGGHLHGLARWNADGSTTFDLPDVAEYVDAVSDNGAIVDPSIYSLSANGAQIVFDSGPTAAHVLTAEYVVAQI